MIKKTVLFLFITISTFLHGAAVKAPFETQLSADEKLPINKILFNHWKKAGITPPAMASDAVFLRRLTLTAAGRLPRADEVRKFIRDKSPDKRAKWIDKILHPMPLPEE